MNHNSIRTAYILQIHKNPEQVNKFITQLISDEEADIYIHIDKRNYTEVSKTILKHPNVKILPESIICEWGDISQVDATILLLKEMLASKNKYDYVCLRSGQDLLVKNGFKRFLLENKGKVFMNFRNIESKNLGVVEVKWPKMTRRRYITAHPYRILRRTLYSLYTKNINLFPNKEYWPEDYSFYCGSQWFTIPFEVAEYIIDFLDENKWYRKYFENSYGPDEWFFHTLIMNSRFKSTVVENNLLYLRWGEHFSDRYSPQILTGIDIPRIEESNLFFARKFDETIDKMVIEYFISKAKIDGDITKQQSQAMSSVVQ